MVDGWGPLTLHLCRAPNTEDREFNSVGTFPRDPPPGSSLCFPISPWQSDFSAVLERVWVSEAEDYKVSSSKCEDLGLTSYLLQRVESSNFTGLI